MTHHREEFMHRRSPPFASSHALHALSLVCCFALLPACDALFAEKNTCASDTDCLDGRVCGDDGRCAETSDSSTCSSACGADEACVHGTCVRPGTTVVSYVADGCRLVGALSDLPHLVTHAAWSYGIAFGEVRSAETKTCAIRLRNIGNEPLSLSSTDEGVGSPYGAAPPDTYTFAIEPDGKAELGPDEEAVLKVGVTPSGGNQYQAQLTVSDDLRFGLSFEGTGDPAAHIEVIAVSDEFFSPPRYLDAVHLGLLDTVVLNAGPYPSSSEWFESEWDWSVAVRPEGSGVEPRLREDGYRVTPALASGVYGFDLAGLYVVRLRRLADWKSGPAADLPITVTPEGLYVEVTWDDGAADLDLHVARDEAAWCSVDDVSFKVPHADWDGTAGQSAGDGVLHVASEPGTRAEVMLTKSPTGARYRVAVDHYAGPSTTATIRVMHDDVVLATHTHAFTGPSTSLEVLTIDATDVAGDVVVESVSMTEQPVLLCGGGT